MSALVNTAIAVAAPRLADYRDRHRGETIVVCGCGESLNLLALPPRVVTIGVNDVGRRFTPDYLVVVNARAQFAADRFRHVEQTKAKTVFTQLSDVLPAHPFVVRFALGQYRGTDFSNPKVLHFTKNSPYVALCLAIHMGASRVGLLGVDFTDHHFFGATGRHPLSRQLEAIDAEYRRLGEAAASRGVEIVNLSPQSRLTAFPKGHIAGVTRETDVEAPAPAPVTPSAPPPIVVSHPRRVFMVNYKFLACGHVFSDGLRRAAAELGVDAADADWDDPALPQRVAAFNPDLLLVVHGRKFVRRWGTTFSGYRSAVWLLDEPYEVDDTSRYSRTFAHVFVNDRSTVARHANAHYLPVCYDPAIHLDSETPRPYRVGFIGGANPRRERYLSTLAGRRQLDYVVGGPWQHAALRSLSLSDNVSPARTAELYRATQIVINVFRSTHHFNRDAVPALAMNPRIYEALACGALVISERRQEISDAVPELPTFDSESELCALIERFLADPGERAHVQAACAARLRAETFSRRLTTIMDVTQGGGEPATDAAALPIAISAAARAPWDGWSMCGPVEWRVDGDVVTLKKSWDVTPGAERGFASARAGAAMALSFDLWLDAEASFIAKIHQQSDVDQTTNSYHLYCDGGVSYLARHNHVFGTVELPRGEWVPIRLSWKDGRVGIEVGGRPAMRFADRTLPGGFAFVGLRGGVARLRRLSLQPTQPLAGTAAPRPDYDVLHPGPATPPAVSIVTTVYDRVECLRRCIRSVKQLSFQDVEQIIVSDAPGPEVVGQIARVVAEEDNGRLHYLNLRERRNDWGISPAAVGLRRASGTFVCFLSDDNGYTPDHLSNLVTAFERDPSIGFAYSSCAYAGHGVLRDAVPRGGRIDLGQPLFKRSLFETYLNNDLPFDLYAWDWAMINTFMKLGIRWRHVDMPSFIFRLAAYPALVRA